MGRMKRLAFVLATLAPLAACQHAAAPPFRSAEYYRAHPDEMRMTLSMCGEGRPMASTDPRCKPAEQVMLEEMAAAAAKDATAAANDAAGRH